MIEPVGRNTAPAIALVAGELIRRDPEAMMLVLPADHVVTGEKAFLAAAASKFEPSVPIPTQPAMRDEAPSPSKDG